MAVSSKESNMLQIHSYGNLYHVSPAELKYWDSYRFNGERVISPGLVFRYKIIVFAPDIYKAYLCLLDLNYTNIQLS